MTKEQKNIEIAKMVGEYQIKEWFITDGGKPYYMGTCFNLNSSDNKWSCGSSDIKDIEKTLNKMLHFDTDAEWQEYVRNFIHDLGYPSICSYNRDKTDFYYSFTKIDKFEGINIHSVRNMKEAAFEALYQFSQYYKNKK